MTEVAESDHFPCVILTEDLGYGRVRKYVVNTETGEVMLKKEEGDPVKAFALGASVCPLTDPILETERLDSGIECQYLYEFSSGDPRLIGPFWQVPDKQNSKPKHAGGKPEYLKLFASELDKMGKKLPDQDLGAAFRMASYCDWKTGILVHPRTKKPLDYAGLQRLTKYPNNTLSRRISALKKAGVLLKNEQGNYKINPELLQKGA